MVNWKTIVQESDMSIKVFPFTFITCQSYNYRMVRVAVNDTVPTFSGA